MSARDKIMPCLWFDRQAEEAAKFYVSVFENGRILDISHYDKGMHMPEGTVLTVIFEIAGRTIQALNGGPSFAFSEAVSLSIDCASQAEIDDLWRKLTADGGSEGPCGWLKDKYGLSWQLVPSRLWQLVKDPDPAKTQRMWHALLQMKKLDIAKLEAAHVGE